MITQSPLGPEERRRYARHLTMPEVGEAGQARLKEGRVLCLGAGGLGSPAAMYLAAAGVGTVGLVDDDVVELSNLQRQLLHDTADVGRAKVDSAQDRLLELNPLVKVERHRERFTAANAVDLVAAYDVVIDGSDNFATRYLASDAAVFASRPNVYGSVFRFEGQASVFAPHLGGPCYRCLFPEPPPPGSVPSCAEAGVLGVMPGLIGTIQALEAIKLLLGAGDPLLGRLVHFDGLKMRLREFSVRRDPECPVCGERPTITAPIDYEEFCGGARADGGAATPPVVTVQELEEQLRSEPRPFLLDVREPVEFDLARLADSTLIPLGELPARAGELEPGRKTVVICKSGFRSAHATAWLQQQGFSQVFNLEGGLDAWAAEIDPSMPRY